MTELSHSVISPMSFRLEYKRGSTGPTMFQRYVRIQVDVNPICKQGDVADLLFAITFTLLSGELCFCLLELSFVSFGSWGFSIDQVLHFVKKMATSKLLKL